MQRSTARSPGRDGPASLHLVADPPPSADAPSRATTPHAREHSDTRQSATATAIVSVGALTRGTIIDADPALAALLGTTVAALRGSDLADHLRRGDPDDAGLLAEVLAGRRARAGGLRQLLTARGEVVECQFSASLARPRADGVAAAILSVMPMSDALRRTRADARAADEAFASAPHGIAIFDAWGRCTRANLAWAVLGGVAAEADGDHTLLDAVEDPAAARAAIAAATSGVRQELLLHAATPDGAPLTVSAILVPRSPRDTAGDAGFIAYARDVTAAHATDPDQQHPAADDHDADLVGPGLVARTLGVSHSTVRRWIEDGRLEATRTAGGHRRVARSELRRIAQTLKSPGRVRASPPPDRALPVLAGVIRDAGAALTRSAARATYEEDAPGWFADPASARVLITWRESAARAIADGRPAGAVAATRTMFAAARDVAGLEECVVFADRLSLLLLRQLKREPGGEDEAPAACQMLTAMRRCLVILEDHRA